ncbi:MAG: bacillithiol system redox-active protein YtxJ [Ekhidna sp.]|nr:bacillithiol system redox-active protein YtxJ [Ekhidna sp.]
MLSSLFSKSEKQHTPWKSLASIEDLDALNTASKDKPVLIFKHSTRCSISAMSLSRFERSYSEEASFQPYMLDLIAHRDVSNEVANKYAVIHESPQAIIIHNGKAVFDSSHMGIDFSELNEQASNL